MKRMYYFAAKKIDNSIFFSGGGTNGLYKYELDKEIIEYVGEFPDEKHIVDMLHRKCVQCNEKLVFIPQEAKNIHIYNLNTREISSINIGTRKLPPVDVYCDEDMLWIFPSAFEDPLLILDLKTFELKEREEFSSFCINNLTSEEIIKFHRIAVIKGKVYMPIYKTNTFLTFELQLEDKLSVEKIELCENFAGAFKGEKRVWMSSQNENIVYEFDLERETIVKTIELGKENILTSGVSQVIENRERVAIIPSRGDSIFCCNINDMPLEIVPINLDISEFEIGMPKFIQYEIDGNDIILYPNNSRYIYFLDCERYTIKKKSMPDYAFNDFQIERINAERALEEQILVEKVLSIKEFIEIVGCSKEKCECSSNINIGKEIYMMF